MSEPKHPHIWEVTITNVADGTKVDTVRVATAELSAAVAVRAASAFAEEQYREAELELTATGASYLCRVDACA